MSKTFCIRVFKNNLANRSGLSFAYSKQLGDYYLIKGNVMKASEVYRITLENGLDSVYIINLSSKYPVLDELIKAK